jgi:hypothetical protein
MKTITGLLSVLGVVALIAVKIATHSGGFGGNVDVDDTVKHNMAQIAGQAEASTEHQFASISPTSYADRRNFFESNALTAGCKTRAEVDAFVAEATAAYHRSMGLLRN